MTTPNPATTPTETDDTIPDGTDTAAVIAETEPIAARTQTAVAAYPSRSPIVWEVEPHLIDRRILAIGRVRDGARINDVLSGDHVAFGVYRDSSEDEPDGATVLYIVPRRHDGRMWPSETDSGALIVVATEYDVSGGRFMIYADTSNLLPNDQRHMLRIWGMTSEGIQTALTEHEIGRYSHSRLPSFSLWALLLRLLAAIWGMVLGFIPTLMWAFIGVIALAVLGIVAVGFMAIFQPLWSEAACAGMGVLNWLPWH